MSSTISGLLRDALDPDVRNIVYGTHLKADFEGVFEAMTEVNLAHVAMLAETKILRSGVAGALLRTLLELEALGPSAFELDPVREEAYFNYEAKVIELLGPETGGSMHLARSRNDLKVTTDRMRSRAACLNVMDALAEVRDTALQQAERHAEVVMPGYTHMQPAQPTTFGFFILGFAKALERDHDRFADAYRRINLNPLGSCAFAGTRFPVDRDRTRDLLGFDGLIEHDQDAVASRDFVVEMLSACALLGLTWSRLAQDLYTMSTYEFDTVHFPDSVFGTSSIMPQKRNPTVLEHLRGRAARLVGALGTTMIAIKGTNFTVSIDGVSDSVRGYYEALKDTVDGLTLLNRVLGAAQPDAERMFDLARCNFSTATDLADALVEEAGLSFRQAHHVVGAVVRKALDRGVAADQITPDMVSEAASEMLGRTVSVPADTVKRSVDPRAAVTGRGGTGGPAPDEVRRMADGARQKLAADRVWIADTRNRIDEAKARLRSTVEQIVAC